MHCKSNTNAYHSAENKYQAYHSSLKSLPSPSHPHLHLSFLYITKQNTGLYTYFFDVIPYIDCVIRK